MDYLSLLAPAWLMGALLVFLTAPLGCLMLWRRMAFFADTLAHGTLLGVALAGLLALPFWVGVLAVSGLLVALLWGLQDRRLPMDALLALCSSALLCSGLLLVNQLPSLRPELIGYLFGDLLALNWLDLPGLFGAILLGVGILAYNWRVQLRLAIDPDMAASEGINASRQRLIFMLVLALFTVLALKAVGTLLMGALLVIPALTARLWARSPRQMVIYAFGYAQLGIAAGLWGSAWLNVATGASIVLTMALIFLILFATQKVKAAQTAQKQLKSL
jgi:zinc transport system permease protein